MQVQSLVVDWTLGYECMCVHGTALKNAGVDWSTLDRWDVQSEEHKVLGTHSRPISSILYSSETSALSGLRMLNH
jgi:hypothetical protein